MYHPSHRRDTARCHKSPVSALMSSSVSSLARCFVGAPRVPGVKLKDDPCCAVTRSSMVTAFLCERGNRLHCIVCGWACELSVRLALVGYRGVR